MVDPYLLPFHCQSCGGTLDRPGTLCLECARELHVELAPAQYFCEDEEDARVEDCDDD